MLPTLAKRFEVCKICFLSQGEDINVRTVDKNTLRYIILLLSLLLLLLLLRKKTHQIATIQLIQDVCTIAILAKILCYNINKTHALR